jgi:hypothetical protein
VRFETESKKKWGRGGCLVGRSKKKGGGCVGDGEKKKKKKKKKRGVGVRGWWGKKKKKRGRGEYPTGTERERRIEWEKKVF